MRRADGENREIEMLEFNESTRSARILAVHYANKVGDPDLVRFMSSESDIHSLAQGEKIVEGFRQMTDLAVEDHQNSVTIEGVADIEFWMYKLFNKVYGHMVNNGFAEVWESHY